MRPPAAKASRPAHQRHTNRARQLDFASFGTVMKDAPGFQPQEDVIYSAAKTAPAPARRTPGAGGTKDNTVLWPETLERLARITAWLIPGPQHQPQCSRQSLLHPSRQPLTSLLLC